MDRGFVFTLIRMYLKKVSFSMPYNSTHTLVLLAAYSSPQFALSPKDFNLTEFRLDFYRIVCSHEHYVTLNLPLGVVLYPMSASSQHSSPSGSISSTFESLDLPNVEAMGDLSQEFKQYHYLSGLVLAELALILDGK